MDYEPESTAVIVVDMQNDFCHPDGALYAPQSEETIEDVNAVLDAVDDDVETWFTKDTHHEGDPEFEQWGEHCIQGTWGHRVHEDVNDRGGRIIRKDTYDAFHDTRFASDLENARVDTVIICGTLANVCVQETASSAALEGFDVYVAEDAVGYIEEEQKERALAHIDFLFGELVTTDDL